MPTIKASQPTPKRNRRKRSPPATLPMRLPSIGLLEEVFDTRRPDRVGKFQGWSKTRCAVVKFPDYAGVVMVTVQNIRRLANERRAIARSMRDRQAAELLTRHGVRVPIRSSYERFALLAIAEFAPASVSDYVRHLERRAQLRNKTGRSLAS